MTDLDWQICDKLIAAGGWLNRAMFKYSDLPPGLRALPTKGNEALVRASLAISDACKLMQEKIEKEKTS